MLSVGPVASVVETQLLAGELRCPVCGGRLAPWGYAALRFVRVGGGVVRRIRPRRAICSGPAGCGRSHVLLPRWFLGRRLDEVAVIWVALLAAARGEGWRKITARVGCPASTVRGWLARFAGRAGRIGELFARVERLVAAGGSDMDRLVPQATPVGDAVAQIGAGLAAVRRAYGGRVFTVSPAEVVAAVCGGWLLGTGPFAITRVWINMSPHL